MPEIERVRGLLRPLPFRGDLIAAGAVVLATGVLLVDARMQGSWASGVRFAVVAAGAAVLLALAWRAPVEDPAPRTYVSTLLLAAFPLSAVASAELTRALGGGPGSAGSLTWGLTALAALYAVPARWRNSAACTLLAAGTAVGALLAAWAWAFSPAHVTPYRWLLLAAILALGLGVARLRDRHRRHAVALVDVAGLSALALAALSLLERSIAGVVLDAGSAGAAAATGTGAGWELVLLAVGWALIAYGAADREPGPAWIGALILLAFVAVAATAGSLLWWPVLLVALGAGSVAAGLRPTTPMPPSPDADTPPAPTRPFPPARSPDAGER